MAQNDVHHAQPDAHPDDDADPQPLQGGKAVSFLFFGEF